MTRPGASARDPARLPVPAKFALLAWMAVVTLVFALVALPADSALTAMMPTLVLEARALVLFEFRADAAAQ